MKKIMPRMVQRVCLGDFFSPSDLGLGSLLTDPLSGGQPQSADGASTDFTNLPAYLTAAGNNTLGTSPIDPLSPVFLGTAPVTDNDFLSLLNTLNTVLSPGASAIPIAGAAATSAGRIAPAANPTLAQWLSARNELGITNETTLIGGVAFAVALIVIVGLRRR